MALDFTPGSSQYIQLSSSPVPQTGEFTMSTWLIVDDYSAVRGIYGQYYDNVALRFYTAVDVVTGKLTLQIGAGILNSTIALVAGTLYHIVFQRDGANDVFIFINAVQRGTAANAIDVDQQNGTIGCYRQGAIEQYFDGPLFDHRIYNRFLSLAEKEIIYHARGADNIVNGLVGRWLMNEKPNGVAAAGANSIIDISGNGNHGTPANSPVYRAAPVRLVRPPITKTIFA